jgi:hypothetical protein
MNLAASPTASATRKTKVLSARIDLLGVKDRLTLEVAQFASEDLGALLVRFQPVAKDPPAPFPRPPLRREARQIQDEGVDATEREAGQGISGRAVVAVAEPGPRPGDQPLGQGLEDAVCDLLADFLRHGGLR